MVWGYHYKLRDILLWIVIVVLFLISYFFTRHFFSFPFLSQQVGGVRTIKEARVTIPGGQI